MSFTIFIFVSAGNLVNLFDAVNVLPIYLRVGIIQRMDHVYAFLIQIGQRSCNMVLSFGLVRDAVLLVLAYLKSLSSYTINIFSSFSYFLIKLSYPVMIIVSVVFSVSFLMSSFIKLFFKLADLLLYFLCGHVSVLVLNYVIVTFFFHLSRIIQFFSFNYFPNYTLLLHWRWFHRFLVFCISFIRVFTVDLLPFASVH